MHPAAEVRAEALWAAGLTCLAVALVVLVLWLHSDSEVQCVVTCRTSPAECDTCWQALGYEATGNVEVP